jgi:hypothetical protein
MGSNHMALLGSGKSTCSSPKDASTLLASTGPSLAALHNDGGERPKQMDGRALRLPMKEGVFYAAILEKWAAP